MYVVLDGYSLNPIGVFDDLVKAKHQGAAATHNRFIVLRYALNKACTYGYSTVYESCDLLDEENPYASSYEENVVDEVSDDYTDDDAEQE